MTPELNLLHVRADQLGYGRMGLQIAKALKSRGVDIYDDLPGLQNPLERLDSEQTSGSKICNTVCWLSVPGHAQGWWQGQYVSILTMWETMTLTEVFREHLHEFDLVIVPSDQNLELFGRYHPNVKRVLLGVDPDRWYYIPRTAPGTFFNFLTAGSGPRKGGDLAVKAFKAAFSPYRFPPFRLPDGPIPRLMMKSPRGAEYYGNRVEHVTGHISASAEVSLYAEAHCYLGPSRGEGFGLQPLQAIAQGIPTILTNAHGHASFAHLGWPIGWTPSEAGYFSYGPAGQWWEPDLDEMVDAMRWIYDHYDAACEKAHASADVVSREWTWDHTAAQFIDAIGPDRLTVPYSGDHAFVQPVKKRYATMVNRPWQGDVAGVAYRFEPGNTYYEVADLKRHLYDIGVLDPACLTDADSGLLPHQLETLGDYSAAHSYCPTCSQRLNSQPTRFDDLYAEMTKCPS